MSKNYYIYILTNAACTVVYTGVTNNLIRRVYEHKNKSCKGFTTKYNVTNLVYFEECHDAYEAIKREKVIKGWTRKKKNILINTMNPNWCDLYETLL